MKSNKRFALIAIVFLFCFSLAIYIPRVRSDPTTNVVPLTGREAMDVTPDMLGEDEINIRKTAAAIGSALATGASPSGEPAEVGDEFTFTVSDNGLGVDYDEDFVVVSEGTHGIILITKDAYDSFDGTNYHFANPVGDDSELWLRTEDLLTESQLTYLLDQFDNNIYPTVTSIYGEPLPRGDEGQKIWILIFNIRDEAYYDPEATSYIAGYFSASESAENNKNIMHIDTYDWQDRTGPDAARPYLYEGTFAHEFEHLVHFDIDPDEPSWVDEGLADMAQFLCDYGHPQSHLAYYMVYHPITALTFWGGGLEDYGASYLFQLYLYEKFGGVKFVSALVQEQANGIEGIVKTVNNKKCHHYISFDEIFDRWTIANYLDADRRSNNIYGYKTLEIGSEDTWGYTIPYVLENMWWGAADSQPFSITSYDGYGDPQPYTAHYYRFENKKPWEVTLDGADFSGTPAFSGTYEWYSDAAAWAWRSFYQSFPLPTLGPVVEGGEGGGSPPTLTLNFKTYFEIEEDWDYGYVEVYDQNVGEWYTLNAAGTVDYVAHGQDNPNTPYEREPTTYEVAGRWYAFTGDSGGWMDVSMDLTPFAGHTIDLYFTTWQDGAFTLQMMYVDDISITKNSDTLFFDDVENGEDGWQSTGWYITDGILDNGWGLTLISTKNVDTARYPEDFSAAKLLGRSDMWIRQSTQSGTMWVGSTSTKAGIERVAIVSNHASHILPSWYSLTFEQFKWHWKHWKFWKYWKCY